MRTIIMFLVLFGCFQGSKVLSADVLLQWGLSPAGLTLRFDLEPGVSGRLERSTDLAEWVETGGPIVGGSAIEEVELGALTGGGDFYRLRVDAAELAPSPAQFEAMIVGTLFSGYRFTSPTRFDWNGEAGDWAYSKTGPDTGVLVLTYDEDGNDPSRYREEMVLTFSSPTAGSYRYSEYWMGTEIPSSVGTGSFAF
jgi:hypothetical protein